MGGGWGSCKPAGSQCGWCHSSETFHLQCMGEECSCIKVDLSCCQNGGTDPSCDPSLQYLQGPAGNDRIDFVVSTMDNDDVCVYYDGHGLFQEVADCCCNNPSNCDRVCEPTSVHVVGDTVVGSKGSMVLELDPPSSSLPLDGCVGDCDSDNDCASGLKCYNYVTDWTLPPGCTGKQLQSNLDYCYDPMWDNPSVSLDASMANGYFSEFEYEGTGYRPLLFGGAIGILTLIMTFALFVVWRRRCRKKARMATDEAQMVQAMDASNVVRVTDDTTITVKEDGTTDQSEVTMKDGSDEHEKVAEMVTVIDQIEGDTNDEIDGKDTTSTGKAEEVMA